MSEILEGLTDAQRDAVTHINGPLLVIAGPGSGKTRVITRRIAYLAWCGIRPWNILAITFTNKAAGEMRDRVASLSVPKGVWLSTFHSYCARVLREFAARVGYTSDFVIYDEDDSLKLISDIMKESEISRESVKPRALYSAIGVAKERFITPDEYEPPSGDPAARAVARVYPDYQRRLAAANAMDFADLIMKTADLLRNDPDALARLRQRHQFVLIDEFQDTSVSQYMIAGLLTAEHKNICVTGDPDQSIYGWRGAEIGNILDFEKDFPGAKIVFLDRNYRSTQTILAAADRLIASNTQRKERALYTSNPTGDRIRLVRAPDSTVEAQSVASIVKTLLADGFSPRDLAVFYRVNSLSRQIEEAFLTEGLPYQLVGCVEFYSRKEVKDVLAYLRVALNRRDDTSLRRIINVPPRGIGPKTLSDLVLQARQRGVSLADALASPETDALLPHKARDAVRALLSMLPTVAAAGAARAASAVAIASDASGYRAMLASSGRDADRLANLDELVNAAAQYDENNPGVGLVGFLEQTSLVADIDNWHDREDRVTLMTMHAAKGLEFPAVIIAGLEEGILPHVFSFGGPREVEEERRIFFVAMTRAMRRLFLLYCEERMVHGSWRFSLPSRFLKEIPPQLLETDLPFDRLAPSAPPPRPRISPAVEKPDLVVSTVADGVPKPGARVVHREFGPGTVKHVSRHGQWHKMVVSFDSAGDKKLIFEMAGLDIV